jgi:hypothetical protein
MRYLSTLLPACLIAALALTAGSAAQAPPDESGDGSPIAAPAAPEPVWEVTLPATPTAAPEPVRQGSHLLLALEGRLELRAAEDGTLIWSRALPPGAFVTLGAEPSEGESRLVAWCWSRGRLGGLEVVGLAEGTTRWTARLPEPPRGPALAPVRSGKPWLVPLTRRVALVDDEGRARPGPELDGPIVPPLLRVAGQPVAALEGGRVQPLVLSRRKLTAREVDPGTAAARDGALFTVTSRTLRAWRCRVTRSDRLRCSEDWSQRLGAVVTAPPALVGEKVIVGSWDTFLYAFDGDTGHLRWRRRVERRLRSRLLIDGPLVAVAIREPAQVRVFELDAGRSVRSVRLPPEEVLPFGPARAGAHLITASVHSLDDRALLRAWPWTEASQASPRKAESSRVSMSR